LIATQYTIALPADYDMGIIRHRVATKGAAYDNFPGLYLKAFLIRERHKARANGNEYAPFYLWPATEALWDFVAGEGFKGIVDSFGWTAIQTWLTLDVSIRQDLRPTEVRTATREVSSLAPGTDLASFREREAASNKDALRRHASMALQASAVEIGSWRHVRFSLWDGIPEDSPSGAALDTYEVLRLSAPLSGPST
jgi:hypothetical protein